MLRPGLLPLFGFAVALAACADTPTAPAVDKPLLAKAAPTVSCIVAPSGATYLVELVWSRVPTTEIVLVKETLPSQSGTVALPRRKRNGNITATTSFLPTAAFFADTKKGASVRTNCSAAQN